MGKLRGIAIRIVRSVRLRRLRASVRWSIKGAATAPDPVLRASWLPGLSVLIPERGTPELLERALGGLGSALERITEAVEIIVVVNGAPAAQYAGLVARFPQVVWQFHAAPLGFSGALAQGLAAVRYGGVYLHNSDVLLEPDALTQLLPWRAPHVFALASQIFFDNPDKRREETGWGEMRLVDSLPELFDREPESDGLVRSGLYAGGGASMFDTALLRQFSANTHSYSPFYWEDIDWGIQAWRCGLEVLFHPGSVVWHRHRATIARHYPAEEVDRILTRNKLLFRLRYLDANRALDDAGHGDADTVGELASSTALREIRQIRAAGRGAPFPRIEQHLQANRFYARPTVADGRPLVLVVSPFHVLPPRHGGARRIWRLCDALSTRWRFILLSDEGNAYDQDSWEHVEPFESVHLVSGRPNGGADRLERIQTHSHARLQDELDRLVAVYQPDLIQVEHTLLAGLRLPSGVPSLLTAQGLLPTGDGAAQMVDFEHALLAKFSALLACSEEDVALLAPLASQLVHNGATPLHASRGNLSLLFSGPLRDPPNIEGLRVFLAQVFPELRRRFPGLEITVLGGQGARRLAATDPLLSQPGVAVEDAVIDIQSWLARCALTINPFSAAGGSNAKLIESIGAGRVCVSTRASAGQFVDQALSGLLVAEDIPGMLEPITRMLADEAVRLVLETPDLAKLQPQSWENAAARLEQVYYQLLKREVAPEPQQPIAVQLGRAARLRLLRTWVGSNIKWKAKPSAPVLRAAWQAGLSIVIPERGTPELLDRALGGLGPALQDISEAVEVIVVVNGAPATLYAGVQARFPQVLWQFHDAPLGFSGALARGLSAARFGAVYLHNSDMVLEPDTLTQLLPWRAPHVFALASQIFFDNPDKRREETGWGEMRLVDGLPEPYEREPQADGLVRSGLYASGGSTLFDTALLRQFSANTQSYAPFYWEDLDWGIQAWRNGLEVLFQPQSVAWHRHRATVARFYSSSEIHRIFERNRLLFQLRHLDANRALADAGHCDADTVRELTSRTALREIRNVRAARRSAPFPQIEQHLQADRFYARPTVADGRPLVLLVSPFHILPPRHGGARRTWQLCEALASRWRFILLSDEGNAYDGDSWEHVGPFESVHLVTGRPRGSAGRIERIRTHSHARLQFEFDRLVAVYRPDLIQIEHVELAALRWPAGVPALLTAHDVLLTIDGDAQADAFERDLLARFCARVACSREDAVLLAPLSSHVVPNGTQLFTAPPSSRGLRSLLFAGPFRYSPNLEGLRRFLTQVFPELRRRFPDLEITVLGGEGACQIAAADRLLSQPGVWVVDAVDDVGPWLARCALTINPLVGTRGSSLKLIESLAAGRVCVCTTDGARGFLDSELPALLVADDIPGMLEPIARLLADEPQRLALERPDRAQLQPYSWASAATKLEAVYRNLLDSPRKEPR